mmetsp:Transcript_95523/g.270178  ORF Transcript_95523/g.270178 Transcript_95523/m.270178 type:complete len:255 (+) Transcript_95523:272-1036(+)
MAAMCNGLFHPKAWGVLLQKNSGSSTRMSCKCLNASTLPNHAASRTAELAKSSTSPFAFIVLTALTSAPCVISLRTMSPLWSDAMARFSARPVPSKSRQSKLYFLFTSALAASSRSTIFMSAARHAMCNSVPLACRPLHSTKSKSASTSPLLTSNNRSKIAFTIDLSISMFDKKASSRAVRCSLLRMVMSKPFCSSKASAAAVLFFSTATCMGVRPFSSVASFTSRPVLRMKRSASMFLAWQASKMGVCTIFFL